MNQTRTKTQPRGAEDTGSWTPLKLGVSNVHIFCTDLNDSRTSSNCHYNQHKQQQRSTTERNQRENKEKEEKDRSVTQDRKGDRQQGSTSSSTLPMGPWQKESMRVGHASFFARRPIGSCNLVLFIHHRLMRGEKSVHNSRIGAKPFVHCET